jgi:hypothetical protein
MRSILVCVCMKAVSSATKLHNMNELGRRHVVLNSCSSLLKLSGLLHSVSAAVLDVLSFPMLSLL